jgi:hypothetical protein
MRLLRAVLAAALLLALAPAATDAAPTLPLGRYTGQTGDGHVFQFTVQRSAKANHPRKITHFYLVYDIANCRSGPIRQPFFTSVYYGATATKRGTFARTLGGERQLQLTGRFRSGGASASGSFKVGIAGKCPITAATPKLTFKVKRAG